MILYTDTSALTKLLLEEEGSAEMRAATVEAERRVSAAMAYVELRSALAAAIRSGRVLALSRDSLTIELERVWNNVTVIPLDATLLRRGGDLAEQMRLRAYDAVHLAALSEAGDPGEIVFACWDSELRNAARDLGYQLLPQ